MTRNSEPSELIPVLTSGSGGKKLSPTQLRLRWGAGILALLNAVALYFYLSPPGGTRQDLEFEGQQIRAQIASTKIQASKSGKIADSVETASRQSAAFSDKYFLPRRTAYVTVFEAIQGMTRDSGISERDAALAEEPVEGSSDLTLLNITANYEGSNADLMKFLYLADHSPMLLMLDTLQAQPQQKNNQIEVAIRFQAIVREPAVVPIASAAAAPSEGQPQP